MNAIFYQNRTGCQWSYLPHDLPAWSAVFYYFTLWSEDGLDQRIQELLRCQVREKARRLEDPSLVVIDTQSVRAAAGVPKSTTGLDADKRTPGRKRGLAVDVMGLIIGVVVLAHPPTTTPLPLPCSTRRPSGAGTAWRRSWWTRGSRTATIAVIPWRSLIPNATTSHDRVNGV